MPVVLKLRWEDGDQLPVLIELEMDLVIILESKMSAILLDMSFYSKSIFLTRSAA